MYILLLCLSFVLAVITHHDGIQGKSSVVDSFPVSVDSLDFGAGYNTITLRRTYNHAVRVGREGLAGPSFVQCRFRLKLCETRAEFFSAVGGGVSALASYMGVAGSSAASFITHSEVTVLDTMLVAIVDVVTQTKSVGTPEFTETSQRLLKEREFNQFVEKFGTHYLHTATLGGKMILIMKFSSTTLDAKASLDTKLSSITGDFRAEAEFRSRLDEIKQFSKMEMSLFAQGGANPPPEPDVRAGIEYALSFSESVIEYPAVTEMQYVALWTLSSAPLELKRYIYPIQGETDRIVGGAVGLYEASAFLTGLQEMRESEMKYISLTGWKEVERLKRVVKDSLRRLQNEFGTTPLSEFGNIHAVGDLHGAIEDLLRKEQSYIVEQRMFLRSSGYNRYISTDESSNPRLDSRAPIGLYLLGSRSGVSVSYGGASHYFIKSDVQPGKVLCMLKSRWLIYWVHLPILDAVDGDSQCLWRVVHSRDQRKKNLSYGDAVLFYNKYWPNYIMGANEDGTNLYCVEEKQAADQRHHWIVDKTQFQ